MYLCSLVVWVILSLSCVVISVVPVNENQWDMLFSCKVLEMVAADEETTLVCFVYWASARVPE